MIDVFIFPNGTYAVTGHDGQQIAKAQGAWLLMIAEKMKAADLNPVDARVLLPNGKFAKFFYTDAHGLNWEIVDA